MSTKILVVDDEPDVRSFLTAVLKQARLRDDSPRRTAGRRSRSRAGSDPDLVILDLMMPNQTGTDFYRRLTKDAELRPNADHRRERPRGAPPGAAGAGRRVRQADRSGGVRDSGRPSPRGRRRSEAAPRSLEREAEMTLLEKRDHTHEDPRVRLKAVEKMTDPETLVKVACTDDSPRVRLTAVSRLPRRPVARTRWPGRPASSTCGWWRSSGSSPRGSSPTCSSRRRISS